MIIKVSVGNRGRIPTVALPARRGMLGYIHVGAVIAA